MALHSPVTIAGTPYHIGLELGKLIRPVFEPYMEQNEAWLRLKGTADPRRLNRFLESTRDSFPEYLDEVRGMADALGWSFDDMFLWQCRGEFISQTQDGCSTLACHTNNGLLIAHNEDGDPFLAGKCPIVDVRPVGKPGFFSFVYPGSIPGHTFSVTNAGLVQTINNVRTTAIEDGIPRIFLCRAVLDATSLNEAVAVLTNNRRAGSYHHTLASCEESRLLSIEATTVRCSVVNSTLAHAHSNHLIHPACSIENQIITRSSWDRQTRLNKLITSRQRFNEQEFIGAMFDDSTESLPIYREDSADPDSENTLATAVIKLTAGRIQLDAYVRKELAYAIKLTH